MTDDIEAQIRRLHRHASTRGLDVLAARIGSARENDPRTPAERLAQEIAADATPPSTEPTMSDLLRALRRKD